MAAKGETGGGVDKLGNGDENIHRASLVAPQ